MCYSLWRPLPPINAFLRRIAIKVPIKGARHCCAGGRVQL
jgi:hypothetical protein